MSVVVAAAASVHLLSLALLVGFMAVVQWSLVPAQRRLDGPAYATLEQGMNTVLERLTPALMIAGLLSGAVRWWGLGTTRATSSVVLWLVALSVLGLAAMVVSTLVVNAPINGEIDRWDRTAPPADWAQRRDRWAAGHAFRSYVGLAALGCTVLACAWPS